MLLDLRAFSTGVMSCVGWAELVDAAESVVGVLSEADALGLLERKVLGRTYVVVVF